MKESIKKMIKSHPVLEKYARIFISKGGLSDTRVTKVIKGKHNSVTIDRSAILDNCSIEIQGNSNEIVIDTSAILKKVEFVIKGDFNKIKIGPRVRFNCHGSFYIEGQSCEINLAENSSFEFTHFAALEEDSNIFVGKDCLFSDNISLITGDSHSIIDCKTNERTNHAEDINIGNHVWVASHVSILKGVTIPDDCVIGTRAVVTKSFDKCNCLIAGVPAKTMKDNITWDRQRIKDRN